MICKILKGVGIAGIVYAEITAFVDIYEKHLEEDVFYGSSLEQEDRRNQAYERTRKEIERAEEIKKEKINEMFLNGATYTDIAIKFRMPKYEVDRYITKESRKIRRTR